MNIAIIIAGGAGHRTMRAREPTYNAGLINEEEKRTNANRTHKIVICRHN